MAPPNEPIVHPEPVQVDLDDVAYGDLVRRLQRNVVAGDVFQIVPSRTFSTPCPDPLAAYARRAGEIARHYLGAEDDSPGFLVGDAADSAAEAQSRGESDRQRRRSASDRRRWVTSAPTLSRPSTSPSASRRCCA